MPTPAKWMSWLVEVSKISGLPADKFMRNPKAGLNWINECTPDAFAEGLKAK